MNYPQDNTVTRSEPWTGQEMSGRPIRGSVPPGGANQEFTQIGPSYPASYPASASSTQRIRGSSMYVDHPIEMRSPDGPSFYSSASAWTSPDPNTQPYQVGQSRGIPGNNGLSSGTHVIRDPLDTRVIATQPVHGSFGSHPDSTPVHDSVHLVATQSIHQSNSQPNPRPVSHHYQGPLAAEAVNRPGWSSRSSSAQTLPASQPDPKKRQINPEYSPYQSNQDHKQCFQPSESQHSQPSSSQPAIKRRRGRPPSSSKRTALAPPPPRPPIPHTQEPVKTELWIQQPHLSPLSCANPSINLDDLWTQHWVKWYESTRPARPTSPPVPIVKQ